MKSITLLLAASNVFLLTSLFPHSIFAVTKISGNLEVTFDEPIFPASIVWYPGRILTKSFSVKNNDSQTRTVAIQAKNTTQTNSIANVYQIDVAELGTNRYGGAGTTMKNFWDEGEVSLSDLSSGGSTTYDITITMPATSGNETQNQTAVFDLVVGLLGTEEKVSILGTSTSSSTSSTTTTVCSDKAPSGAPVLLSAVAGTSTVTLSWGSAGSPVSYYLIAYGTSPGQYLYGANVGLTNSYVVTNLSGGRTYYFVVRGGNGCAPGPFSGEIASFPSGPIIGGIAEGFAPNVLGEATLSAQISPKVDKEEPGEIAGEKTKSCTNAWWWWIAMVVYGLFTIALMLRRWKENRGKIVLLHLLVSLVVAIILVKILCSWWLAVLITSLIGLSGIISIRKKNELLDESVSS